MVSDQATVKSPWVAYLGLLFGTFTMIEAMSFQIPALPVLTKAFGIPVASAALISLCYYLTATVFGPVFGNIADQVGRKRIALIGMVIFSFSEFMAAASMNYPFFLAARLIQGIGVACVIPAGLSYATYLFPPKKRGVAIGVYSAVGSIGSATGGILGGLLITKFGWQSLYLVNGTLAILGIILVKSVVPETPTTAKKPFDLLGSILLLLTVGTWLSMSILVANLGFKSPVTLGFLALAIIFALSFWKVEKKCDHPTLDFSILKNRYFIAPIGIYFFIALCSQGSVFTNSYFVTAKPGLGTQYAGILTSYIYIVGIITSLISGKLSDKVKIKNIILTGIGCFIIGALLYSQYNVNTPFWYIVLTLCVMSGSLLLLAPSCMKMSMSAVPKEKLGTGSGTYIMIRDLGSPTGQTTMLAAFGAISAASLTTQITAEATQAGVSQEMLPAIVDAAKTAGKTIDPTLLDYLSKLGINFQNMFNQANFNGMVTAVNQMSFIIIGIAVAMFIAALIFLPSNNSEAAMPSKDKM
ncbi:MFS transporter [Desulfitobacterium sp.]|uniref:MFS transporter n=1 Tax=Desulfitobacterium sp. TaxID=49981 RepID=UPI002CA9930A|nr:MFS transporter [Desulfitobacterium sp.]HVJ48678.1 MFS transporter [Desulfitobacterium sp.]